MHPSFFLLITLALFVVDGWTARSIAQDQAAPLAASALHAEPSSKTPEAFAQELAEIARKCWLRRETAFSAFASAKASTTTSTRGHVTGVVEFGERRASTQPTPALRILVVTMNRNELTVIAQQRGAADAVPVLDRDIGELLKRGRAPC